MLQIDVGVYCLFYKYMLPQFRHWLYNEKSLLAVLTAEFTCLRHTRALMPVGRGRAVAALSR